MPNSKAAKFVAANPLAPMADPFSGIVSFEFRNNKLNSTFNQFTNSIQSNKQLIN